MILLRHAEPAEPSEQSEPAEPSEPTESLEPAEPADASEPSEPADPSEPSEHAEPSEPSEPAEPSEQSKPSEPAEPSEPSEPADWSFSNLSSPIDVIFVRIHYTENMVLSSSVSKFRHHRVWKTVPYCSIPNIFKKIVDSVANDELKGGSMAFHKTFQLKALCYILSNQRGVN